jgi:hypothetical protein
MKNFQFKFRKLYEKVEEGNYSNAIIKYREHCYKVEQGRPWPDILGDFEEAKPDRLTSALYSRETWHHGIKVDMLLFELSFDWETVRRVLNRNIHSLDHDYLFFLFDEKAKRDAAKLDKDVTDSLKKGYIGRIGVSKTHKGFPVYVTNNAPLQFRKLPVISIGVDMAHGKDFTVVRRMKVKHSSERKKKRV